MDVIYNNIDSNSHYSAKIDQFWSMNDHISAKLSYDVSFKVFNWI